MSSKGCDLCVRRCHVLRGEAKGFCQMTNEMYIARAALHLWEEPPISAGNGSGTVFFSGCNLRCCYCQNEEISVNGCRGRKISVPELVDVMLNLEAQGAANINLVTPTPHVEGIIPAIDQARKEGLSIPIVYNTGGYDSVETIRRLEGLVQIYLPDFKYAGDFLAQRYSKAPGYAAAALEAIKEMHRQVGDLTVRQGVAVKGVLVRHLVLPNNVPNAKGVLDLLKENFSGTLPISIMRQYTPMTTSYPELDRALTGKEYRRVVEYAQSLGFEEIYTQQAQSASEAYIPQWDL